MELEESKAGGFTTVNERRSSETAAKNLLANIS
jgi:hypothetical protein